MLGSESYLGEPPRKGLTDDPPSSAPTRLSHTSPASSSSSWAHTRTLTAIWMKTRQNGGGQPGSLSGPLGSRTPLGTCHRGPASESEVPRVGGGGEGSLARIPEQKPEYGPQGYEAGAAGKAHDVLR